MTREKLELIDRAATELGTISALIGSCKDLHQVPPIGLSDLLAGVEVTLRRALDTP